jgi:hypothetical protein
MIRVECHHSGGLIESATAADEAPRFAWILQTGLNRPAGNASLNSLSRKGKCLKINQAYNAITWGQNDRGDSELQKQQAISDDISPGVV